jgi:hypothetical protein
MNMMTHETSLPTEHLLNMCLISARQMKRLASRNDDRTLFLITTHQVTGSEKPDEEHEPRTEKE